MPELGAGFVGRHPIDRVGPPLGHVQGVAIGAKGDIGGAIGGRVDHADDIALRIDDIDPVTVELGDIEITLSVQSAPIGSSAAIEGGAGEAETNRSILAQIRLHQPIVAQLGDIQILLIRRERDPIGIGEIVEHLEQPAIGSEPVDRPGQAMHPGGAEVGEPQVPLESKNRSLGTCSLVPL